MRALLLGVASAIALSGAAHAASYYVSPIGRDTNAGTTPNAPFLTIQHAADLTNPGDVVNITAGTYAPFVIKRSGTVTQYITYQNYAGQAATISATKGGNAIEIGPSNNPVAYIKILGLNETGDSTWLTSTQALAAQTNDPLINGACIDSYPSGHDIIVSHNHASYCPGPGIQLLGTTGIQIDHNEVDHNAYWSPTDMSGIVVNGSDQVFNNFVHDNINYQCNRLELNPCRVSDGRGIIYDTGKGHAAIYNNVVWHNGLVGIAVVGSPNASIDIYNNTTYYNSVSCTEPAPYTSPCTEGEIAIGEANSTQPVRVMNNIMYGDPHATMFYAPGMANPNLTWDYNVEFGGQGVYAAGPHDQVSNPSFTTWLQPPATFHVQEGSIAVWTGEGTLVPAYDADGLLRTSLGPPTRGAYAKPTNNPQ